MILILPVFIVLPVHVQTVTEKTGVNNDVIQITYPSETPVTVLRAYSRSGAHYQDLILGTAVPGIFTFPIAAYDGSDATIKDVTYTVLGTIEPTFTPMPTANPTEILPEPTATPTSTPTAIPIPTAVPTNTPRPGNVAPKLSIVPDSPLVVAQNSEIVISVVASDCLGSA